MVAAFFNVTPSVSAVDQTYLPYSVLGEDYLDFQGNTGTEPNGVPATVWDSTKQATLTYYGVNTLRLVFSFTDTSGGASYYDYDKMDDVLDIFDALDIKAILCHGDEAAYIGSQAWVDQWTNMTDDFSGDDRIEAFQLINEPYSWQWSETGPTGGVSDTDEILDAVAYLTDEIRGIDASRKIVVPVIFGITLYDVAATITAIDDSGVMDKGNMMIDIFHPYFWEYLPWDGTSDPTERVETLSTDVFQEFIDEYGASNCWLGETFPWSTSEEKPGGGYYTEAAQEEFEVALINECIDLNLGLTLWCYFSRQSYYSYTFYDDVLLDSDYMDTLGEGGGLFSDGFETETDDFNVVWTGKVGSPTVGSTTPFQGNKHIQAVDSGNVAYADYANTADVYARAYVQVNATPSSNGEDIQFIILQDSDASLVIARAMIYRDSGVNKWGIAYYDVDAEVTALSSQQTNPSANSWYSIEIRASCSQTVAAYQMWINGTELTDIAQTGKNSSSTYTNRIYFGIQWEGMSASVTMIGDCVIVDSSYIGPIEEEEPPAEDTYTLTLSITAPENTTYTQTNIAVLLSASGNDTVSAYSWNVLRSNSSWVYGTNKTGSSTTMVISTNGTYTFCCLVTGVNEASDYDTVEFSVAVSSVPPALPYLSVDSLWLFLFSGDIIGFFYALLTLAFTSLDIAVGVISMLFLVPLYLRTKSLLLVCIAWILIGSFLIVLMPLVSLVAVFFLVMGIGGVIYRLFRPSSSY